MIKQLLLVLGVAFLVCLVAKAAPVESPLDIERNMTVLVTNVGMEGMGAGTGVVLDNTHVLTCFHMANRPNDDFMVYTYPLGRVLPAHIEGGDKGHDLLILVLDSSVPVAHTPVFQEASEVGEPVTVIGNALGGMQWFVTKGIISGFSQGFVLTDALINPGNSGGPWFNDKGEIVALTDWGIGPLEHIPGMAGGISAKAINRLLNQWGTEKDMMLLLKALGQK